MRDGPFSFAPKSCFSSHCSPATACTHDAMSLDEGDVSPINSEDEDGSSFSLFCSPVSKVSGANVSSFYGARKSSTPKRLFPIFTKERADDVDEVTTPTPGKKRKASSPGSAQGLLKKNKSRRLPFVESKKQYAIDVGQWDFDGTTCKDCRMVYTKGEVSDEKHHSEYHNLYARSVKWSNWKKERCWGLHEVCRPDGSTDSIQKIIAILPSDPKVWLNKVDSLFTLADRELGINNSLFECKKETSVYLVLVSRKISPAPSQCDSQNTTPSSAKRPDERVAGFLAAEGIRVAGRLVSENPLCVSTDDEAAVVGVARIWVHHDFRRQGVGSKLLDTLRGNFLSKIKSPPEDRILKREEIAFSDPTIDGLQFAKKYTGQEQFLVYQYQP